MSDSADKFDASPDLSHLAGRIQRQRGRRNQLVPIVVSVLRESIETGEIRSGMKLANEIVLAEQLDVSRPTLRQAIGMLVHDGVLNLKRGVGTFVTTDKPPILSDVEQMRSATQLIQASGRTPATRDCEVRDTIAGESVAQALRIDTGDAVITITRTRLADRQPLIACFEHLPASLFGSASEFAEFDGTSLYRFLATCFDIAVDKCETSIAAISARADVADRLAIPSSQPVLELTQQHFSSNRVVLFSHNYHNTRLIRFRTHRTVLSEQIADEQISSP